MMTSEANSKFCCRSSTSTQDSRLTPAVFALVVAVVLGAMYWGARIGLADNPPLLVLQMVGLSLFAICLPVGSFVLGRNLGIKVGSTSLLADAVISLLALLILSISGMVRHPTGVNPLTLLVTMGYILGGLTLIDWLRSRKLTQSLALLVAATAFGVAVGSATWGSGFQNPLYAESITAGNYLCRDILLPASVSSMLKTYGIPSFGLDGLTYCYYHWGAYWFFAQISEMFTIGQVEFGQLGYPVIFIPFMIGRFLTLTLDIAEKLSTEAGQRDPLNNGNFWVIFFLTWIGFLPTDAARTMLMGGYNQYISETYCVGLSLAFIALSLTLWLYGYSKGKSTRLCGTARPVVILMLFLVCMVGLTKISLMFLLLMAWSFLALRLGLWRDRFVLGALLFAAALTVLMVKLTVAPHGTGFHFIYPLGFFISNVTFSGKPFFFLFYYWAIWLLLAWRCCQHNVTTLTDLGSMLRRKRLIEVETVIVVALAGAVPAFSLAIPGASGHYFADFQCWCALALLLADSSNIALPGLFFRRLRDGLRNDVDSIRLSDVLAVFVTLLLLWVIFFNVAQSFSQMLRLNLQIRCAFLGTDTAEKRVEIIAEGFHEALKRLAWRRDIGSLRSFLKEQVYPLFSDAQKNLENVPAYSMFQAFREVAALPREQKRESAIFIPHTVRMYWNLLPYCDVAPFVAPSFTGVAMIDGIPQPDCQFTGWAHHYSPYRLRTHNRGPAETEQSRICSMVRAKGFSAVIFVQQGSDLKLRFKRVACPVSGQKALE